MFFFFVVVFFCFLIWFCVCIPRNMGVGVCNMVGRLGSAMAPLVSALVSSTLLIRVVCMFGVILLEKSLSVWECVGTKKYVCFGYVLPAKKYGCFRMCRWKKSIYLGLWCWEQFCLFGIGCQ